MHASRSPRRTRAAPRSPRRRTWMSTRYAEARARARGAARACAGAAPGYLVLSKKAAEVQSENFKRPARASRHAPRLLPPRQRAALSAARRPAGLGRAGALVQLARRVDRPRDSSASRARAGRLARRGPRAGPLLRGHRRRAASGGRLPLSEPRRRQRQRDQVPPLPLPPFFVSLSLPPLTVLPAAQSTQKLLQMASQHSRKRSPRCLPVSPRPHATARAAQVGGLCLPRARASGDLSLQPPCPPAPLPRASLRRVHIVRGEGRDLSGQYGEGGGGASSVRFLALLPSRSAARRQQARRALHTVSCEMAIVCETGHDGVDDALLDRAGCA